VRLKLFADDIASLKRHRRFTAGDRPLTLKGVRDGPNGPVARFAEIGDRGAAEALRGTLLTVDRADLPPLGPGEYYHADLIGLPCVADDGAALGTAAAVDNYGAGDVLEIAPATGAAFLVPVAAAVTIEADRLVIDRAFVV